MENAAHDLHQEQKEANDLCDLALADANAVHLFSTALSSFPKPLRLSGTGRQHFDASPRVPPAPLQWLEAPGPGRVHYAQLSARHHPWCGALHKLYMCVAGCGRH